jgi:hypothetical protein
MKRRELLGKMAVMTSGSVLLCPVPANAENSPKSKTISDDDVTHSTSRHVFYASRTGAKLDSNVHTGGGTDDTAILQSILDKASEMGRLHLIMDGASLIKGLKIHSNTTLECLNTSCGFFLAPQSNCPIIVNANPSINGERKDINIALIGGTYNHNCKEQVHHYTAENQAIQSFSKEVLVIAMQFFGVENFIIRGITIRNQRTWAMLMGNWYRVNIENVAIDLPDHMIGQNQDGLHFWGPGQFLSIKNVQGQTGDDFINLAPDENDHVSSITDCLIDGVFLNNCDNGIRLLSADKGRLDRVVIKNITGTYRSFGFYIHPWWSDKNGNFGNIIFDTIDLRQTENIYDYTTPFLFRLGGKIESLTLRNIYHHQPADNRPILDIGWPRPDDSPRPRERYETIVNSLLIDGLHIFESDDRSADATYINVLGRIDNMVVRNVEIIRDNNVPQKGCLIQTTIFADIKKLFMNNISVNRLYRLISHKNGKIGTVQICNVMASEIGEALIVTEKEKIDQLNADAVYGAKLIITK